MSLVPASPPTTVVLADDHAVMRSGLRMLLDAESDLEVVAVAGDVPGTLRVVAGHKPDVLILDLNMPGGSSLAAIPALREGSPQTQIVVLTMQREPAYARRRCAPERSATSSRRRGYRARRGGPRSGPGTGLPQPGARGARCRLGATGARRDGTPDPPRA